MPWAPATGPSVQDTSVGTGPCQNIQAALDDRSGALINGASLREDSGRSSLHKPGHFFVELTDDGCDIDLR